MVVEIARHDAVLQHAGEHDAVAARRPGESAGQREVGREQHRGAEPERASAAPHSRRRHDVAIEQAHDRGSRHYGKQYRKRRAMGRRRERNEQDQRRPLAAAKLVGGAQDQMQGQHGGAGENVGEQDAGDPWQRGGDGQHRHGAEQREPTIAEAVGAQHQRQHPHGGRGLQHHHRPEIERPPGHREQPVDGRAARHQVALVPPREVTAGVVLQEGETVP